MTVRAMRHYPEQPETSGAAYRACVSAASPPYARSASDVPKEDDVAAILTTPVNGLAPCDGTMTCTCELCAAERERRVVRSIRPPARQPWQPKAA